MLIKHALLTLLVVAASLSSATAQVSQPQSLSDLRVIGEHVVQAVLRKDVAGLLAYEWEGKAEEDDCNCEGSENWQGRRPIRARIFL
jgi:hypothetical protein